MKYFKLLSLFYILCFSFVFFACNFNNSPTTPPNNSIENSTSNKFVNFIINIYKLRSKNEKSYCIF